MTENIIKWFGGKDRLTKYFMPFPKHRIYVEPFCGSAIVLLKKIPSEKEVINDINERLINFWRVIQRTGYELELFKLRCKWYGNLNARKIFENYMIESVDSIEDAFRFFYVNRHSFSGLNRNYHGIEFGKSDHQAEWNHKLELIEDLSKRMQSVNVECQDFRMLLKRTRDQPDILIYVDSPYFKGGDSYEEGTGGHEWSQKDFEDLRDILWNFKQTKIVISIDDPKYFTKDGWFVQKIKRVNSAQKKQPGVEVPPSIEYVIRNFDNDKVEKMRRKKKQGGFMKI